MGGGDVTYLPIHACQFLELAFELEEESSFVGLEIGATFIVVSNGCEYGYLICRGGGGSESILWCACLRKEVPWLDADRESSSLGSGAVCR